jgi:hypothetical protein
MRSSGDGDPDVIVCDHTIMSFEVRENV